MRERKRVERDFSNFSHGGRKRDQSCRFDREDEGSTRSDYKYGSEAFFVDENWWNSRFQSLQDNRCKIIEGDGKDDTKIGIRKNSIVTVMRICILKIS